MQNRGNERQTRQRRKRHERAKAVSCLAAALGLALAGLVIVGAAVALAYSEAGGPLFGFDWKGPSGLPRLVGGMTVGGSVAINAATVPALPPSAATDSASTVTPFLPRPSDTPHPTATASATATLTVTASGTPSATPSSSASPTSSPSPSAAATLAWSSPVPATRTPTRTRTPLRTPTRTPFQGEPSATVAATDTAQAGDGTTTAISPPTSTVAPPSATPVDDCAATGNSAFESRLLELINAERQSQGLNAYRLQSQLQSAARRHSQDMACNGFLSHTGSDGSSVRDRVEQEGYDWSWIGENIFATGDASSSAPQRAFDWWMNSAPHRANLLSPNYTEIGLGYRYLAGSGYGGYFTAVFARP